MNYILFLAKNIEIFLIYLFVFLLPFNIKKYLKTFGEKSFNFESGFIHILDILTILIFAITIIKFRKEFLKTFKNSPYLLIFAFTLLIPLLFSKIVSYELYFYFLSKLILSFTLFYIVNFYLQKGLLNFKSIRNIFLFSMLIQSFIIINQFYLQKNLFGDFSKFLGESVISPLKENVSKIDLENYKIIRSYGTLPHPNIAATFLFTSIFFVLKILKTKERSLKLFIKKFLILSFLTISLYFTFSRIVLLISFSFGIYYLLHKKKYNWMVGFIFIFVVIFAVLWLPLKSRIFYENFSKNINLRAYLNEISINIIKENFFTGIGVGNFIENIDKYSKEKITKYYFYQPVHNIYLLIFSESGIFGILAFLFFLGNIIKKNFKYLGIIFLGFLIIGFFDHHFITLEQARYLFFLIAGALNSKKDI